MCKIGGTPYAALPPAREKSTQKCWKRKGKREKEKRKKKDWEEEQERDKQKGKRARVERETERSASLRKSVEEELMYIDLCAAVLAGPSS